MKFVPAAVAACLSLAVPHPAAAALAVGTAAPDFAADGTQGGMTMVIDLSDLLAKGSVVLFFFPSAFTDAPECRAFAAAFDTFRAAGASVLGISRDSIDTLARFSSDACAGKVPLARADENLVNAFDVNDGAMFNSRTTYVIAPSGTIAFVEDGDNDADHVRNALAFVQRMKRGDPAEPGAAPAGGGAAAPARGPIARPRGLP